MVLHHQCNSKSYFCKTLAEGYRYMEWDVDTVDDDMQYKTHDWVTDIEPN